MRWLVLVLLLIATPTQAGVVFFSGAETGDLLEWTTVFGAPSTVTSPVFTGAYALTTPKATGVETPAGLNLSTAWARFYWQSSNAGNNADNYILFANPTTGTNGWILGSRSAKLIFCFGPTINGCTAIATGATTLTQGLWFQIEAKLVVSTTVGGMEVKICTPPPCTAAVEFTSLGTNTGTSNITSIDFGPLANPAGTSTWTYDNIILSDSGYLGAGGSIARQGASGSPTYTAWTLNSCTGGTIDGCWSETPFTATTPSASSTVLNDAQTMVVHDFATTQSGHGTETIGNASTINACKTYMVANAGGAGTLTMRRRISGSDTDTAKTVSTTNAYYDDGIWTTTAGVLRNSANMEIGAKQGANTVTQTVRDMGLICDFANASQAPKHRVIQQ